jgi:hypothetical protein
LCKQFIDGFLREAYSGYQEASQDLCIITTKNKAAYQNDEPDPKQEEARRGALVRTQGGGPMKTPSRPPWSMEFQSPFLGLSPEQVAEFVSKELNDTILETRYCAIIDGKSLQDRSAPLVKIGGGRPEYDEPKLVTVRQPFGEVNAALGCYSIGELDPEEHLAGGAPSR